LTPTGSSPEATFPRPDGRDNLVRHLLFLRRRPDVPAAELRRFVTGTLEPVYARHRHRHRHRQPAGAAADFLAVVQPFQAA
jgi:hypothetical protein